MYSIYLNGVAIFHSPNINLINIFTRRLIGLNYVIKFNKQAISTTPVSIPPTNVEVIAGGQWTLSLDSFGRVWSWGSNSRGQLGDNTIVSKLTPVRVCGSITFCRIFASADFFVSQFSLGIDNRGRGWGWGSNDVGGVGDNTTTSRLTPVRICGGQTFCKIYAGFRHAFAIDNQGRAWGWGLNPAGQLGDNSVAQRLTPVRVCGGIIFCEISAGKSFPNSFSLGIDSLGRGWSWGVNLNGQLGDNTTISKRTPIRICGSLTFCRISAGPNAALAIDNRGRAWGWGINTNGLIGDNTTTSKRTPIRICGGQTFCQIISAGNFYSIGLDNRGRAWGWGNNNYGNIGDNTITSRLTPVRICGGHTFCKITAGSFHTLGIDSNGRIWGWGSDQFGGLGDNSIISRRTPVRVCNL